MDRNKQIKEHFDHEAQEFDAIIQKIIPYYDQMIEALISSIPFEKEAVFSVIDLGCGTGNVAKKIQENYPNAQITCMDMSEKMLEITNEKLSQKAIGLCDSFDTFVFEKNYDAIVSSLALHHLANEQAHREFYSQIYQALNPAGVFINADMTKAVSPNLQEVFMEKWIEFMSRSVSMEEIKEKWLTSHFEEDRPVTMTSELKTMEIIGFKEIEVSYKYYNYAVYMGTK